MRQRLKFTDIFVLACALIAWGIMLQPGNVSPAAASQPPDPTEQLRPYADKLVAVLTDPDLQGEEKKRERYDKLRKIAQERLDFREMSQRALGRTWRELEPAERDEFVTLFTQLLEHAYLGQVEEYSNQQVVFKDQRIRGDRAQVMTDFVDGNKVYSVSYIMMLHGDKWMVYDVVAEGVSLVKNYMEQFREIIRKDGYTSLVRQIEEKIAGLKKNDG